MTEDRRRDVRLYRALSMPYKRLKASRRVEFSRGPIPYRIEQLTDLIMTWQMNFIYIKVSASFSTDGFGVGNCDECVVSLVP